MHVGNVYHVNHDFSFTARFRSVLFFFTARFRSVLFFFINTADNKKRTAKK